VISSLDREFPESLPIKPQQSLLSRADFFSCGVGLIDLGRCSGTASCFGNLEDIPPLSHDHLDLISDLLSFLLQLFNF
jgi:hypothetical protein